jgi:hypothetical protein
MRLPPLEKDGRGGNFATGFARLSACRRADSTSSDIVCPRLAASRFTARIVASLIESVVFIWKTIRIVWFSVKLAASLAQLPHPETLDAEVGPADAELERGIGLGDDHGERLLARATPLRLRNSNGGSSTTRRAGLGGHGFFACSMYK